MEMDISNFVLIEKEDVASLHFPKEEILEDTDLIAIRKSDVNRAISLGNLEHSKVKIYFADDQGEKVVNTTIWAVTDVAIVLKQLVMIPINRIIKLEI
jgi:outer membrane protease